MNRHAALFVVVALSAAARAADPPAVTLRPRGEVGGGPLDRAGHCAYTPDGKAVLAAGPDGSVYVVDPAAGRKVATLTADPPAGTTVRAASSLTVSPDGKLVALACQLADAKETSRIKEAGWDLRVWDRAAGKLVARRRGERWDLGALRFSPDGRFLAGATGGYDPAADRQVAQSLVWAVPGFEPRGVFAALTFARFAPRLHSVAVVRDGPADVLVGSSSMVHGWVSRWDVGTGRLIDERTTGAIGYHSVVSLDGRSVLYSSPRGGDGVPGAGGDAHVIDVATAKPRAAGPAHRKGGATGLAYSPDGKLAATSCYEDRATLIHDAATLAVRATVPDYGPAALSPDGQTLTFAGTRYYDAATGRHRFTLGRHSVQQSGVDWPVQVWALAWSPDGKTLATSDNGPALWLGDPTAARWTRTIPLAENTRTVTAVAYTPDGKTLASAEGSNVRLFDAATGAAKATLVGHTSGVNAVAVSPDGRHLASGSGTVRWVRDEPTRDSGEVIVWDLGANKPVHTLKAHPAGTFAVAFSPDGKTLATGGGDLEGGFVPLPGAGDAAKTAVRLWDVATGKPMASLPCSDRHHVSALAFSPDGKTLAHAGIDGGMVRLVDLTTGKGRADLPCTSGGTVLAFGSGGLLAVAGSAGGKGTLELWDAAAGKPVASAAAHEPGVNCVGFSPDGKVLATGSSDGAVWLWDVVRGGK